MNVLTITGNLGKDAQIRSAGGTTVASFSVAAKSGYGDKEQTIWVDCSIWGARAESKLVDYLKKGQMVCVTGEMGTREYEGKTYITLRVDKITLCGGRSESRSRNHEPARSTESKSSADPVDDDIPF